MSNCICVSKHGDGYEDSNAKQVRLLRILHSSCVGFGQVICFTLLITGTLWLFLGLSEPTCSITKFELEAFKNPSSNNIIFDLTLHNPDIYKGIRYEDVAFRLEHYINESVILKFDEFYQAPGGRTTLPKHSISLPNKNDWKDYELQDFKNAKESFTVSIAMEYRYTMASWTFGPYQFLRSASVFFDVNGTALVNKHRGVILKL